MILNSKNVGDVKKRRGRFKNVYISDNELDELHREFGSFADEQIEQLSAYKASIDRKYASDFAAVCDWCQKKGAKSRKEERQCSSERQRMQKLLEKMKDETK